MVIFFILNYSHALCQGEVFDLDNLDNVNFKNFVTQKKVIAIGEIHGTTEVPQFVMQLTKILTVNNKPITVGLEINLDYQGAMDEFLENGDFDNLVKLDYFKNQDGRTSIAIGELLKELRNIKNINVICFDVESGSKPGINRDSLMAVNLTNNLAEGQMIILMGNVHANLNEGFWKPNFKSALYYLNRVKNLGNNLVTLVTLFGGGTIWNCTTDGCMERDAYSNPGIRERYGLDKFIGIYEEGNNSGYDGFIYFNSVTASRPLVY